ncbi:MAG: TetR family transcriptional regulator [Sneathiella sp.]|nr:TetR family transcriptional regulator [Sneathiella sp.]
MMNNSHVRRATNEDQKIARRQAILDGARQLFVEADYFDVSMAIIAKRSGLAKGTVYLYFKTKEEIFLSLSTEELENWLSAFETRLREQVRPLENTEFVDILRDTFMGRHLMQRLVSLLHLVLEKNITYEEAFAFKLNLKTRMNRLSKLVEQVLPFLAEGQGFSLLSMLHCLVVGSGQMSDPSPVLKQVLEHPEMEPFRVDLEKDIFDTFSFLLEGMKSVSENQSC